MVFVSEEVRCVVCKSIFCCLECRNRHEMNAHNANDVWTERNRMRCGFCQGYSNMEFQNRNDFALIMHLCQTHLPLHCKKCLTQFNSISDFSTANKCAHMNDVCSLQSPKECSGIKEILFANVKDASQVNYITAIQKSSFERSISDSVTSLRNYSTILQTSNHSLYKTQSPDAMEKALVRQTSTPMHNNLLGNNSPGSNGQSCSSCLASSASAYISSINSSSDSDTSNNSVSKANEIRQNVQQQSIMVAQKKTTMLKRSKHSTAGTPLTRQVMTKSIHRAILEYQNSQNNSVNTPKSPLDLRVRSAVNRDTTEKTHCEDVKGSKNPQMFGGKYPVASLGFIKPHSVDANSKLETVYEQAKDVNSTPTECFNCKKEDDINYEIVEISNEQSIVHESLEVIEEKPVLISRNLSEENGANAPDVWFTPREFAQSNVVENIEIYTPKVSKKRPNVRRFDEGKDEYITEHEIQVSNITKSETSQTSGNKLWSFVSTFFRFASLTPATELSMPLSKQNGTEPHTIIKRCASFSGILRETNTPTTGEDNEHDPLQPIKRRRITSMDASMDSTEMNYNKRIMCRPPIRRMQNN